MDTSMHLINFNDQPPTKKPMPEWQATNLAFAITMKTGF